MIELQLKNAIDWWLTENISIALLDSLYVYDVSHTTYANISPFLVVGGLSPTPLSGKTLVGGVADAANYIYIAPTFNPLIVKSMWLIRGVGAPTDKLVAFWDDAQSTLPLTTIGGVDVLVSWHASGIFQIA